MGFEKKQITQKDLFNLVERYNPDELKKVKLAYEYANLMHGGQLRKSGEPYIIHPVNVAYLLALYHADGATLCAGLLHDCLEDTKSTKEEITKLFGEDVAKLVDGVTNLDLVNFNKEAQNMANMRKIIGGIVEDVRIVIIKLCDRLHNMRTLEYKSPDSQRAKAIETLSFYVPLAYFLGAYELKKELEDLSLRYLSPTDYFEIMEQKLDIEIQNRPMLAQMASDLRSELLTRNIENDILIRTKNAYGIYKALEEGHTFYDIHDLLALKVLVPHVEDCYITLGLIHSQHPPVSNMFKDYIALPKINMYKAVHTTLFAPSGGLVQARIKTFEMDQMDQNGLMNYWAIGEAQGKDMMMQDLRSNYQFFKTVQELDETYPKDEDFIQHLQVELFEEGVMVHMPNGRVIKLPKGATPIDFAYYISEEMGNTAVGALVNEENVPLSYELKNNDRVQIVCYTAGPVNRGDVEGLAKTTLARKLIKKNKARD